MRQAGRYLPEYRAIREKTEFMDLCKTPELAAEVSIQPIDRLGVDAAIIFSDILLPLEAMGLRVVFQDKGPIIANSIRNPRDLDGLCVPDVGIAMPYLGQAIGILRERLAGAVPVIGFAGAPWTLASYALEGKGSKAFGLAKKFMLQETSAFYALLDMLADTVISSLETQIKAGAELVQVFDSWVGQLSQAHYRLFALPSLKKIAAAIQKTGVPLIYYLGGGPHLADTAVEIGADVLSLDWRVDLPAFAERWGHRVAVQGNIDPCVLYTNPQEIRLEVRKLGLQMAAYPGHIWNLGHGILPDIPVENAQAFVKAAQELVSH
jgi:uroporphyrinogen decarboxylase